MRLRECVKRLLCLRHISHRLAKQRDEELKSLVTLLCLTVFEALTYTANSSIANGQVAQLVERGPEKAGVGGSIPSLATILFKPCRQLRRPESICRGIR